MDDSRIVAVPVPGPPRWLACDGAAGPPGVPVVAAGAAADRLMAAFAERGWPEDDSESDPGVIAP